ncbi:signal peptidase I [Bacillus sp. S3]|uniref:signal peptidase I n=1 Tax=Bacillus sp. S3 TaxID=486398 RepID=UPI00118BEDA5|nr:signal peptidase I [Bacillus sp. S3]QCJ44346.1 signal peptidase I [Bacillus sp. S3]
MKLFIKIVNVILAAIILSTICAAVGTAITKKPFLLTVIRSNSMVPVWERGDMVILENLNKNVTVHQKDIVFFKTEAGDLASKGWIAHRVISGNDKNGFITKGDANEFSDQESSDTGPIKRAWITGRAWTVGEKPIVIPKIGYLSLWMEKYHNNPYTLPVIAVILAIFIAIGELKPGKKRRNKKKSLELELIYFLGGLTLSIIVGGTMLASSQKVNLVYEVSKQSQGVLMGSNVGVLKVGDEVTKPLSEIANGGIFPLVCAISTNDAQVTLSHTNEFLSNGQKINSSFKVNAEKPGKYKTSIRVGLFYPLLPASVIFFLAGKSYWLALVTLSFIPGLPLMAYPFIDRKMRRRTFSLLKKKRRKMQNIMPF